MLLSGQSYFRRWPEGLAPGTGPNLADAFKQAGYYTYHYGKRSNVARRIHERFDRSEKLDDDRERRSGEPGRTIVDGALQFLAEPSRSGPWLMLLEFEAPHDPRVAAEKYLDLYQREKIPLPENYAPLHPFDNGEMVIRDERLAPWPRTAAEMRRHLHEYYAVISGLDHHIGRLLASLDQRKLRGDTLTVFLSDHGLALGSHGLMGKQNLYEHSMRAPVVFSGPGIPRGSSDALVYLLDVFPTVCELAGVPAPADVDGISLAGIMAGRQATVRESLFTAYRDVQRAVRDERWKLIRYPQVDQTQLFDLAADPDELHNLADDAAQAERVTQLTATMRDWQQRLGDTLPLRVENPRPAEFHPPGH